eukprot:4649955-Pleurochrysis_carterae.AAC.1
MPVSSRNARASRATSAAPPVPSASSVLCSAAKHALPAAASTPFAAVGCSSLPPSRSMAAATAASTMSAASTFLPAAARNCAAARAGTRTPSSDASTPSVHSVLAR